MDNYKKFINISIKKIEKNRIIIVFLTIQTNCGYFEGVFRDYGLKIKFCDFLILLRIYTVWDGVSVSIVYLERRNGEMTSEKLLVFKMSLRAIENKKNTNHLRYCLN